MQSHAPVEQKSTPTTSNKWGFYAVGTFAALCVFGLALLLLPMATAGKKGGAHAHHAHPSIHSAKLKYWNGKPKRVGKIAEFHSKEHVKKVRHGLWKWWWPNGRLKAKHTYHYGKQVGVSKSWYSNGKKRSLAKFQKGLKHGVEKLWYSSGQLKSLSNYQGGKLHGTHTEYWWDGRKAVEAQYRKGKKDGTWAEWYYTGDRKLLIHYKNDKREGQWYEWWLVCKPSGCNHKKITRN